ASARRGSAREVPNHQLREQLSAARGDLQSMNLRGEPSLTLKEERAPVVAPTDRQVSRPEARTGSRLPVVYGEQDRLSVLGERRDGTAVRCCDRALDPAWANRPGFAALDVLHVGVRRPAICLRHEQDAPAVGETRSPPEIRQ